MMARLIDAHDLWSDIMMLPHNGDMISSEEVEQEIIDAKTVDAVEVVRCKDCIHAEMYTDGLYCYGPIGIDGSVGWNEFCSYGERRTNEAD